jgi:hypothetical protein
MRPRLAFNLKLLIALAPVALVAAGCARTLCVKVVDASSGRPLSGVSASWQQYYHGYFHTGHEGPTNLPPSGDDGLIRVGELHRNWSSYFIFSCPGYSTVYGEFTPSRGQMIVADEIKYFPPGRFAGEFYLKGNMTSTSQSNGCFVVPLPESANRSE